MTAWGVGCGWLRGGRRQECGRSFLRGLLVGGVTLALFFLIVGLLSSMSGCTGKPNSGVRGTVTIGPTQPVAQAGTTADSRPYAAKLVITPTGGLHLKRPVRVESDANGKFSAALEPGTWVIEADGQKTPPTLRPVTVTVEPDRYTSVTLAFDSGIR